MIRHLSRALIGLRAVSCAFPMYIHIYLIIIIIIIIIIINKTFFIKVYRHSNLIATYQGNILNSLFGLRLNLHTKFVGESEFFEERKKVYIEC